MPFFDRSVKKKLSGGSSTVSAKMPSSNGTFTRRSIFQRKPTGGSGQMQAMVQRPKSQMQGRQNTVVVGKRQTLPQPQQQKQLQQRQNLQQPQQQEAQHQSVISMEEVMKDLQILEEQQKESQRHLQRARETKQRRMEQHSKLEAKLRELKYKHGQDRAVTQRMHEKLSQGHRFLALSAQQASDAGNALRAFDELLKNTLDTKRRMEFCCRLNANKLALAKSKLAILKELDQKGEAEVENAKRELDQAEHKDSSLRELMRKLRSECQKEAEETAHIRSRNSQLQNEIDSIAKNRDEMKQKVEAIKQNAIQEENKHQQALKTKEEKIRAIKESQNDLIAKIVAEKENVAQEEETLRTKESRIIEIQIAETHVPPTTQPGSKPAEPLDLRRIRASYEAETKAYDAEINAKKCIEGEIESLRAELKKAKEEENQLEEKDKEQKKVIQGLVRKEQERRVLLDRFVTNFEDAKQQVSALEAKLAEKEAQDGQRSIELQTEVDKSHKTLLLTKEKISATTKTMTETAGKVEKVGQLYDTEKEKDEKKREARDRELASLRHKRTVLATKVSEKEKAQQDDTGEELAQHSVDEIKAEMARLLEDYPILCDVTFSSDTNMSEKERLDQDLGPIRDHVEKRVNSARKLREELREANRLEEEERARIEANEKAEKQRKRQARQERDQRMGQSSSMPKDDIDADKRKRRRSKKRSVSRSKSMYLPEVESAAKPKDLLSAFSQASSYSVEMPCASESKEKKVHWDDSDDSESLSDKTKPSSNLASNGLPCKAEPSDLISQKDQSEDVSPKHAGRQSTKKHKSERPPSRPTRYEHLGGTFGKVKDGKDRSTTADEVRSATKKRSTDFSRKSHSRTLTRGDDPEVGLATDRTGEQQKHPKENPQGSSSMTKQDKAQEECTAQEVVHKDVLTKYEDRESPQKQKSKRPPSGSTRHEHLVDATEAKDRKGRSSTVDKVCSVKKKRSKDFSSKSRSRSPAKRCHAVEVATDCKENEKKRQKAHSHTRDTPGMRDEGNAVYAKGRKKPHDPQKIKSRSHSSRHEKREETGDKFSKPAGGTSVKKRSKTTIDRENKVRKTDFDVSSNRSESRAAKSGKKISKEKYSNNCRVEKISKEDRPVLQTAGISSMERPNKSRRRKKVPVEPGNELKSSKAATFDKDLTFNFL